MAERATPLLFDDASALLGDTSGGGLPLGDWQFWVVTLVAAAVLGAACRGVLRAVRRPSGGGRPTRVRLTVSAGDRGGER